LHDHGKGRKGILVSEINAGQMVQDVRLAVNGAIPVEYFGRLGGIVPEPDEIVEALKIKTLLSKSNHGQNEIISAGKSGI
jgi:2-oxoglutarate ferredoxin oxidoreductase subunit alpha